MSIFQKKILVTGGNGMLAADIYPVLKKAGAEVISTDLSASSKDGLEIEEFDISNPEQVFYFLKDVKPDWIINCAAYTNVDNAEKDYDTVFKVNSHGAGYLAMAASALNTRLLHISTDYVFGGKFNKNTEKKLYQEEDFTSPCGIYGHSKKFGEELVLKNNPQALILRTSWLHGINGPNFIDTMLKLGKEKKTLSVVDDQVGTPTWSGWLAEVILKMMQKEAAGIFHASSSGLTSRFDQAKEIFKQAGLEVNVVPQSSEEAKRPAPRPFFSAFSVEKLEKFLGEPCLSWQEGISQHLKAQKVN